MSSDSKIYVDAGQPATLNDGAQADRLHHLARGRLGMACAALSAEDTGHRQGDWRAGVHGASDRSASLRAETGVISSGLSTGWHQADVSAGPPRMMDGCGEQKRAADAARARPLASLSHHHAHCIKEIFHFWWAIMQLKYDSPGLTWIQKSHTYSILCIPSVR